MALFEKKLTIDELKKRLADFDRETARLAGELDKAQRRVSAVLARDENADKVLAVATSLKIAMDARPAAKAAIERELRRLQRAEQMAGLKKSVGAAQAWATGPMAKAAEQLVAAVLDLSKALASWDDSVASAPLGTGPAGGLGSLTGWQDARRLFSLSSGLEAIMQRKGAGIAEGAIRWALSTLQQQAPGAAQAKLGSLEAAESSDPEPALLEEPAVAAAEGGS